MGQKISTENTIPHEVSIPGHGKLTGYTFQSSRTNNKSVHRFAKVPYSLPCTGQNRFKVPRAIPNDYDYTDDYKEFGLKCPQPSVPNPAFRYTKSPSEEDITYLNIWIPASDKHKPKDGWPVLIYIHGGWLQYSTPNTHLFNTNELFDDEEFADKFILVTPGYRLNIFGFLSCKELLEEDPSSSNFGFWDQRMAIEWTYKFISHFGGNKEKITLGGISAGAYSTFFQLAYELYNESATQIIKQVIFFSNMVYVQPKKIEELQDQFDEIIEKLGIDKDCSSAEKLAAVRGLDTEYIEEFIPLLKLHTFRAVTDDKFVSSKLIEDIATGKYAKKLASKNVRILLGEVDNELVKYSMLNTPETLQDLILQIENYYPKVVVPILWDLYEVESLDPSDPEFKENLRIVYGKIISDGQVYASSRGFISKLADNGFPKERIFRYKIAFRAKWLDEHIHPKLNVPHGADMSLWFYALREGYTEQERKSLNEWMKPYLQFLHFSDHISNWRNEDIKCIKLFQKDGSSSYVSDPDWEWGTHVANRVYRAQICE